MWRYFKGEKFSFWMICFYLFFEYFRPQSIYPAINIISWAQWFLMLALVGTFFDKSIRWVSSPINKLLGLFAIVIFASSLNAYYPEISKKYYIDFYSWVVVYFLIINIINTKQRFYIFIIIFVICAAKISIGTSTVFALRGFAFTDWGLRGPPGYFTNSGELSILMLTFFPVAYLFYQLLKNRVGKLEKVIMLLFCVTPILTVLGASSRGAQIALVIQLVIMFRKSIFKIKPLIALFLLGCLLYNILPDKQISRFETIGEDKTSQQRLLYWEHGLEMIQKHPFLGVGYFNFPLYYETHYPEDMLYEKAQVPHNIFIQVGTDAGWLGLIPFIMLLILPFWTSRKLIKLKDTEEFVITAINGVLYGLLGFIIAGQFVTVAYYPFLWIGLAFIVAAQNIIIRTKS